MNVLLMRGVRGGVGTTSISAALGYALHGFGKRVLLIDACPGNMLRLHLNIALNQSGGWARAATDGLNMLSSGWELSEGLCLLPYGNLAELEQRGMNDLLQINPALLIDTVGRLRSCFDWLVMDLPHQATIHPELRKCCDISIRVIEADPSCHLLANRDIDPREYWLVNKYQPAQQLQRDLNLLWRQRQAMNLLPTTLHMDVAVPEALAHKLPVGCYAPASQAAHDSRSIALWCLSRGNK
jgi:cellulose synthase operon protein YhjQ